MPYEMVENFAGGLDNRKSTLTAPGGTLTRLTNAMITPGGEIAKRRGFVKVATVSSNCFGLATHGASLFVFGRNALPTITLTADGTALAAAGTIIQRRLVPNTATDLIQTDSDIFNGKVYIACQVPSLMSAVPVNINRNPHYYDDENTADADMIATEGIGKGFYIRSYQSKMYSVLGGLVYFSAIGEPRVWNTATDISPVVVTNLSDGFPARCTVAAADITKFKNGKFVVVSGADTLHKNANGFHRISSVNVPVNTFLLDEVDTTASTAAQTTGVRVDAAPTTGCGYINLSSQSAGSENLTGIEVYYSKLALFSNRAVQVWAVDPDPLKNQYEQLLRGVSTTASNSPLQYGSGDVLFLDSSGIRSLKAKDSSNSASVSDIGSPIDTVIRGLSLANANKAVSILEPSIGRFWMVFQNEAFVLSDFPGPKITAWSRITLPFTMQHVVSCNGKLFFRDDANQIWVYGGANAVTYNNADDDYSVEVRLPYVAGKKPGHNKSFEAIDVTAQGTWDVKVSYEYGDQDTEELVGTVAPTTSDPLSASTWNKGRAELTGYSSHLSLRFYNSDNNPATLSNVAVHYQIADEEA